MGKTRIEKATFSTLPSLRGGGPSEALGIDDAGTVIVGTSWDRYDALRAVKWSLQNGSWVITSLPYGSKRDQRDCQEREQSRRRRRQRLPRLDVTAGSLAAPADSTFSDVEMPSGRQRYMESVPRRRASSASKAAPPACGSPASCRTALPAMFNGASAGARTVNGDGTIVGGAAGDLDLSTTSMMPVRWTLVGGQWQIEQLDTRPGVVYGANGAGDLAGHVSFPCALADGCNRAVIWYAAGGSFELGTLGGEHSLARDINGSGEVVGSSTAPRIGNTGFFWSPSRGMSAAAAVQRTLGRREWRKRRATGRHASRRRHELAGRRSRVGRSQPLSV